MWLLGETWLPRWLCSRWHHHRLVMEHGRLTLLVCDRCRRAFPLSIRMEYHV